MIELSPERIASVALAQVLKEGPRGRPVRAVIDSREVEPGDLFFGLRGERADGGAFAARALDAGAWGVVVEPKHAQSLVGDDAPDRGWVLAGDHPLRSLQSVAREWRRELGCPVVGITGSTGKTSVKDIGRAILPFRVHASPENFNTEVGLPLAILAAPPETEVLVLEMAMRGRGQIAELCGIAEPDVAAITNVGPVHLELLGTIEAIAEAKAEILAGLGPRGRAIVPVDAEALVPHLNDELITLTFGAGGDVFALASRVIGEETEALIGTPHGEARFRFPFTERHNLVNAECAVAIGVALDAPIDEMAARASQITFSRLRGEVLEMTGDITVLNDCYNANPLSMRAALDHLIERQGTGRRLAVLGGMAELGPQGPDHHREVGAYARGLGVSAIIGVGELARDYAPDRWAPAAEDAVELVDRLLEPGDTILVKGSRAIELERFTDELRALRGR